MKRFFLALALVLFVLVLLCAAFYVTGICLTDRAALTKIDPQYVPSKAGLYAYSSGLPVNYEGLSLTEAEEIEEIWAILQTETWQEEAAPPEDWSEFAVDSATVWYSGAKAFGIGNELGYSIVVAGETASISLEFPGILGSQRASEFSSVVSKYYEVPAGIDTKLREYALARYNEETADVTINDPEEFLTDFFNSPPVSCSYSSGGWSSMVYNFEYFADSQPIPSFMAAMGDFSQWEVVKPAVSQGSEESNAGAEPPPPTGAFRNFDSGAGSITLSFAAEGDGTSIYIKYKDKAFFYYSPEDIPAALAEIIVPYYNEYATLENPRDHALDCLHGFDISLSSADAAFMFGSTDGICDFLGRDCRSILREDVEWQPVDSSEVPPAAATDVTFDRGENSSKVVFREGGEYVYVIISVAKDFYFRVPATVSFSADEWLANLKTYRSMYGSKSEVKDFASQEPPTDVISALNEMLVQYQGEL